MWIIPSFILNNDFKLSMTLTQGHTFFVLVHYYCNSDRYNVPLRTGNNWPLQHPVTTLPRHFGVQRVGNCYLYTLSCGWNSKWRVGNVEIKSCCKLWCCIYPIGGGEQSVDYRFLRSCYMHFVLPYAWQVIFKL